MPGNTEESRATEEAMKNKTDGTTIRLGISDLMDALPFYVMLVDEDHYILQANRAVRARLGLDPKDIVGKYCPAAVHGLDKPIDGCPLEEAVERDQAVEREIFDAASGRWVRSAVYPTKGSTADGRKVFFHMVTDITDRKRAEEELTASREQLRELSRHLESIREEERTELAREIHDEMGQLLTGLKIDVSWIARRLPKTEVSLLEKTRTINELIDEAVQTIKRISSELRPGVLDHLGLVAAIEWQAQELEKRAQIRFEVKSTPKEIALDGARSTTLFRICQEALTNVIRHADASRVRITLRKEHGRILLRISDNGRGIQEQQVSDSKAFGLIAMRERARYWGGDVKISGRPGKGTVVVATIPLD
jgi:PAS domain S-box-containing protein